MTERMLYSIAWYRSHAISIDSAKQDEGRTQETMRQALMSLANMLVRRRGRGSFAIWKDGELLVSVYGLPLAKPRGKRT